MLGGFVIIMLFLMGGDLLSRAGVPLPGNVIGMMLLTSALALKFVKAEWVRPAAEFLVDNLSLLFVPAGVGVMAYFDIISRNWLPIAISVLLSTLLIVLVAGTLLDRLTRIFERLNRRRADKP